MASIAHMLLGGGGWEIHLCLVCSGGVTQAQGVEELQENVIRLCCNREGRQEVEYYLRLQEEI